MRLESRDVHSRGIRFTHVIVRVVDAGRRSTPRAAASCININESRARVVTDPVQLIRRERCGRNHRSAHGTPIPRRNHATR